MTPVYTKPVVSSSKQTAKTSFDNYSQISNDDDYSQIPVNDKPLKVGDKVKHSNFGHGRIIQITGYGSQTKAIVNFDRIGNKVLMLSFAKLDRV
jgi:DNA helicase-2/ATP-dependent DNA helicase PcrA